MIQKSLDLLVFSRDSIECWQVTSAYFCAGLVFNGYICSDAAPILKLAKGKNKDYLRNYFGRKNWRILEIDT